jgi:hypothetical protein
MDERPIYMISVAADLVGMHPQTLRIYEQKGLVRPQRTPGGTRLYSEADVERLRIIQRLTTELGLKSAGGVVAGGGVVAAKAGAIGGLGKFFVWLFLWNGISSAARIGGWIGIALVLALIVGFVVWRRTRTV